MRYFLTLIAFVPIMAFSQLHVSSNAYIYNNDRLLFVKDAVSIANNANIYLRNEAQLLQNTTSLSLNSGLGSLSTFQEGTSDNFDYNYWCSPVGLPAATVGNSPFGITLLNRATTNTASTPAIMLSNTAFDGISNPLSIAPRWIFKFLNSSNYSQWIPVLSASTIMAGEGFTMKGTSGNDATIVNGVANNPGGAQRYDFRGKPNSGNITIGLANNQMTLTGNPYPSAIDLSMFLTDALNTTGVAYFWEHDKTVDSHLIANYRGGYGTFSPVSRGGAGVYVPAVFYAYDGSGNQLGAVGIGANYARRFSPIGQGFMIMGNNIGTSAIMRDTYRVYQKESAALSVFEKGANVSTMNTNLPEIQSVSGFDYTTVSTLPVPQIRFNALLNNMALRQTVLAFDPEATDNVDHAMDAPSPDTTLPSDTYFVMNNSRFVISVIDFDQNKRLPIGVSTNEEMNFKFTVAEIINFDTLQHVYLFDKVTQIYHNIVNEVFETTIAPGTINDRFEVTFTENLLATNSNATATLAVHQNNANQILTILNPNLLDIKQISLYDIAGKRILKKEITKIDNQHQIETAHLSEGVYIVKIKSDAETSFRQKFIVNRN